MVFPRECGLEARSAGGQQPRPRERPSGTQMAVLWVPMSADGVRSHATAFISSGKNRNGSAGHVKRRFDPAMTEAHFSQKV